MSRAREQDVRDIVDSDSTISMAPFIEMAGALVDRVSTCATAKSVTLTTTELRIIEELLAAHFYSLRDPLYRSKKTADASAEFNTRSYLEEAKLMDPSGCLTKFTSGKNIGVTWLGKPKSTQTDYVDRD
jgi:hypothetical protein